VFSLLNKAVRLNFSGYKCKLLKFSLTALLTSKSIFLTFDLLGLLKCLSPFSTEPFTYKRANRAISVYGTAKTLENTVWYKACAIFTMSHDPDYLLHQL